MAKIVNIKILNYVKDCGIYADFFKASCEKFKSGKHNIDYTSIGPNNDSFLYSSSLCSDSMSQAHALSIGVDWCRATLDKDDIVILADSDICILRPDWDLHIIEALEENEVYGFEGNSRICKKFPSLFFMVFKVELLDKVNFNFFPSYVLGEDGITHINTVHINTKKMSLVTEAQTKTKIKCDTGWQIPIQCRQKGIKYNYLKHVSARSSASKLPNINKDKKELLGKHPRHYDEWHYNKWLFGTHCQASRAFDWDSEHTLYWREKINAYTQKEYGFVI